MTLRSRRVDIDDAVLRRIRRHLPEASINWLVQSLLDALADELETTPPEFPHFKDAAIRIKDDADT